MRDHGYGVLGKKKHVVKIDNEMARRAFEAMYGVHDFLLKKEARSRRRKAVMKKQPLDNNTDMG